LLALFSHSVESDERDASAKRNRFMAGIIVPFTASNK
jgi:hypothetical protein